jgi:hypothetical protein
MVRIPLGFEAEAEDLQNLGRTPCLDRYIKLFGIPRVGVSP